ncbi:MAG: hypothetical protein ACYDH5_17880 [Acidimicrobiales bacterium]
MPVDVVLDPAVIVGALSQMGPGAMTFPAVPPRSGAVYADALGVFSYQGDSHFALILSNDLVEQVVVAVASRSDLGWMFDQTDQALERIARLAQRSGGGFVTPAIGVSAPPGMGRPARTALQAAASKDLGHLRMVVTEDASALRIKELQPHGIPFPPNEPVTFVSPARFAVVAEQVRWRMRQG